MFHHGPDFCSAAWCWVILILLNYPPLFILVEKCRDQYPKNGEMKQSLFNRMNLKSQLNLKLKSSIGIVGPWRTIAYPISIWHMHQHPQKSMKGFPVTEIGFELYRCWSWIPNHSMKIPWNNDFSCLGERLNVPLY